MEPSEKLKPCPFCGGEAELHHDKGPTGELYAWVGCNQCDAMSVHCDVRSMQPEETHPVDAWNTRDQRALDELQAEIDRLTKERDEAAAKERAKVVAWLRGGAGTDTTQLPRSTRALFLRGLHGYADAIEQGAHHDPE